MVLGEKVLTIEPGMLQLRRDVHLELWFFNVNKGVKFVMIADFFYIKGSTFLYCLVPSCDKYLLSLCVNGC